MSELQLTGTLWINSSNIPDLLLGQHGISPNDTLLPCPPVAYEGTICMLGFGPGSQVSGVVSAKTTIDTAEVAVRCQAPFSGLEVVALLSQALGDLADASYRHMACRPRKSDLDQSILIATGFTDVDGVMMKILKRRQQHA